MNSNNRGETILIVVLILGLSAFVIGSFSYAIQLRLMPLISGLSGIGLLFFILAAKYLPSMKGQIYLGRDVRSDIFLVKGEDGAAKSEARLGDGLRVMMYIVGLWTAVAVSGLVLSIFAFIFIFLKFEAGVRFRRALIGSVVTITLMAVGLHVLGITMWTGVMPTIVPGYVGGSSMPPL